MLWLMFQCALQSSWYLYVKKAFGNPKTSNYYNMLPGSIPKYLFPSLLISAFFCHPIFPLVPNHTEYFCHKISVINPISHFRKKKFPILISDDYSTFSAPALKCLIKTGNNMKT